MTLNAVQHTEVINDIGQIDLFGIVKTSLVDGNGKPVKQLKGQQESQSRTDKPTAKQLHVKALKRDRKQQIDDIHNLPLASIVKETKNIHIVNINRELKK